MGYQPWLQDDPESTLITWNRNDQSSYKKYVDRINEYLSKYDNVTYTRACSGTDSNSQVIDNYTGKVGSGDDKPVEVSFLYNALIVASRYCWGI